MENKYDATYYPGEGIVHIVAPEPMSDEELEWRKKEFYEACWMAWNSLSTDAKLRVNTKYGPKSAG